MKPGAPWAVKLVHESKEQGLSPERIRQKLVHEGLEPEKIDSVLETLAPPLSPTGTTTTTAACDATDDCSSSPARLPAVSSPQRRQLSVRYANAPRALWSTVQ